MNEDLSKRITLRLPAELHEVLTNLASDEGRSLNNQIVWLLKLASDPNRLSDEKLHEEIKKASNMLKHLSNAVDKRLGQWKP